jgi:hypothetical protein
VARIEQSYDDKGRIARIATYEGETLVTEERFDYPPESEAKENAEVQDAKDGKQRRPETVAKNKELSKEAERG